MKYKRPFFLCSVAVLSAGTLQAAIDLDNSATFYSESNWYAIRNGGEPGIASSGQSVTISNFKYDSMFFCYFDSVSLKGGESLLVSGTLNFESIYGGSGKNTVIGLFDSKTYSQTALNSALGNASLGNAYNSRSTELGAATVTGDMAGFLTSLTLAYNRNNPSTSSSCVGTNSGGSKIATYETAFSEATAGTDYAFSLSVQKEEGGTYVCAFSLGDASVVSYSAIENELIGKFDVLAFKLPVGTGDSVTLSDFSITVIPEPSMFGFFAGALSLVALSVRRRRL